MDLHDAIAVSFMLLFAQNLVEIVCVKDSDGGCDRRRLAGTAGARSVSMLSHQMTETREFADSSTVLVFPVYPLKIEFSHTPNVVAWKFQDAETWGNEQTHKVGCARQGR